MKYSKELIDKLNNVTRENLTGIRVVRAFNAEKYQEDKFEDVNNKLTNQQLYNQIHLAQRCADFPLYPRLSHSQVAKIAKILGTLP